METKNLIKELQCLYAWAEFYRQNQQWSQLDKIQEQIAAFKFIHDLE